MSFRTRSGRILTDADIQALSDEAERGYDVEKLKRAPRPHGVLWCRIFGHRFQDWAGRTQDFCLRCGARPDPPGGASR